MSLNGLGYVRADFRPKKGRVRKFARKWRDEIIIVALIVAAVVAVCYVSTRGLDRQIEKAGEYADRVAAQNWPEDGNGNLILRGDEI